MGSLKPHRVEDGCCLITRKETTPRTGTNRGLRKCIDDQIPVGVLRERAAVHGRSRYDVLGLALPVTWSDGHFFFQSLDPPPVSVIDPVSDLLEATAVFRG
jgi:hypothetical protein